MIDQIGYSTDRRRYGLFWESELVASTQVGGRITINKISSETKKKATSIHNNFRNNYSGICSLDEAPSSPYITHTLLSLLRLDCLEYIDSTGPRYNMARNRSSTLEIASSFDAISHFASTNILERTGMQLRDSCDLFEGTLSPSWSISRQQKPSRKKTFGQNLCEMADIYYLVYNSSKTVIYSSLR